jgi:hypothetical protein
MFAIRGGLLAVTTRLFAIACRLLAVSSRPRAPARCPDAARAPTRAQLLYAQGVAVREIVSGVDCHRLLVEAISNVIAIRRKLVSSLGRAVSLPCGSIREAPSPSEREVGTGVGSPGCHRPQPSGPVNGSA